MFTHPTLRRGLRRCLAGVAALALAGSLAAGPAQAATPGRFLENCCPGKAEK